MNDSNQSILEQPGKAADQKLAVKRPLSAILLVNAGLFVLALLAVVILWISTIHGAGIGGDATIYITSAQNLLAGKGLGLIQADGGFRLLPYFPPFFSLVLAGFGALGVDLAVAARWLNILLFAATVWLVGGVTFSVTRSVVFALLAAGLMLVSPVLIPVYSWAMSEPLAIFLSLAGLALLLPYLRTGRGRGLLALAALLMGLSILTRYAQVAFLAAGGLGILLLARADWGRRLVDLALYGLIGALPAVAWVIYDVSQTATVSSRSVESVSGMAQRLANLGPALQSVFLFWFVPDSWIADPPYPAIANRLLLPAALALLAIGFVIVLLRRKRAAPTRSNSTNLIWLLAFSAAAYLLVIGLVSITTYPPITIASRMLSPVHVVFVWLAALVIGLVALSWPKARWLSGLMALGLVAFFGWYGWRSARIVQQNYELGLGYNSVAWQESQTVQWVQSLPEGAVLVTNEEMALLYLTGRTSYPLAEIYANRPLEPFSVYGQGDLTNDPSQQMFQDGKAGLVLFDTLKEQIQGLYGDQTDKRINTLTEGLKVVFRGADGAVYALPNP